MLAVQLKLCLYIFTPRKIGGRSWFPNLTTWGPWVGDDEKPLVSAFEMKNPSLRVGNIIIHRKHARMCGFHYGTPMEIIWTKWKWWNYWIKLFSEIMATQWTLFPGFWKALLFWVFFDLQTLKVAWIPIIFVQLGVRFSCHLYEWGFPKIGVPQNTPKW